MTERAPFTRDELARLRHDIRTPLGALVGLAAILSKLEPLTPKQVQIVETMKSSADDLSDLLEALFADLESAIPQDAQD